MPYLRLYLPEISIAQKRHIAQKLIDLTLRTSRRRRIGIAIRSPSSSCPNPESAASDAGSKCIATI